MTVILSSVAFWAPVTFIRVGDDLQPEKVTFRARFKRLKKSERVALDHRIAAAGLLPQTRQLMQEKIDSPDTEEHTRDFLRARLAATPTNDAELLNEVLVDWDLKDHRGDFVPYTPAIRAELEEDLDGLEGCMAAAFMKAMGVIFDPAEQEKNSAAQSATTS